MAAWRPGLTHLPRAAAATLVLLLAAAGTLAASGGGHGALQKPLYAAGDRWVYAVKGSLGGLPGANASQGGTFLLGLNGIAEVDVVGPASGPAGGVRVTTHASGFLNGTLEFPGSPTIGISGTFSSNATEIWREQDYLPVASNSSTGYIIDVKVVITAQALANLWLNTTTTYGSQPPFNLSVGDSAFVPFTSDLSATTIFSFVGGSQRLENRTSVAGVWTRQVLTQENITVEAGTFSAYRLNESLGAFPGFATGVPSSGANETAWFSNDVGYYVKRVAYVNGTPVAEMRLKSYTYPAPTKGLAIVDIVFLVAVPVAVAAILLFLVLRWRRGRRGTAKGSSGAGPVGELPPKNPGGSG